MKRLITMALTSVLFASTVQAAPHTVLLEEAKIFLLKGTQSAKALSLSDVFLQNTKNKIVYAVARANKGGDPMLMVVTRQQVSGKLQVHVDIVQAFDDKTNKILKDLELPVTDLNLTLYGPPQSYTALTGSEVAFRGDEVARLLNEADGISNLRISAPYPRMRIVDGLNGGKLGAAYNFILNLTQKTTAEEIMKVLETIANAL